MASSKYHLLYMLGVARHRKGPPSQRSANPRVTVRVRVRDRLRVRLGLGIGIGLGLGLGIGLGLGLGLGIGLGLRRTFATADLCDGGPEPYMFLLSNQLP